MADTQNILFRNSINGYNKSDVNGYLIKINNEFSERENAVKERAAKCEAEAKEANGKSKELISQLDALGDELEKKQAEISSLLYEKSLFDQKTEDMCADYENKLLEAEIKLQQQDSVISEQFGEIEALKAKLEKANDENLRIKNGSESELTELKRKAQLYEKTSSNIGDTILSANKTAEEIIACAKEEARLLREKTQADIDAKISACDKACSRALENIWSKLKIASEENLAELSELSEFTRKSIEKALYDIKCHSDRTRERISNSRDITAHQLKIEMDSVSSKDNSDTAVKTSEKNARHKALPHEKAERKERALPFFFGDPFRRSKK